MAEPLLKVEALEAGYGEVQILWGISLAARRGQLEAVRALLEVGADPNEGAVVYPNEPPTPALTISGSVKQTAAMVTGSKRRS